MSYEQELRGQATADETTNPAARESNGEDSVRTTGGRSISGPKLGAERPYVRGETFVIDRTDVPAIGNPGSPKQPAQAEAAVPLFDQTAAQDFRSRWNEIQVAFVDEPREAVGRADNLVAETIRKLSESFTSERQKLESEWDRDATDSTEALRVALQRYRSFFNRLLSV